MFSKLKNEKEIKTLYCKLALRLHPDYGGSNELMILLTEAYELRMATLGHKTKDSATDGTGGAKKCNPENHSRFYEKVFGNISAINTKIKILDEILDYAKTHEGFESDFVNSVKQFLNKNSFITSGQYNALVNIYYSFNIHQSKEKPED